MLLPIASGFNTFLAIFAWYRIQTGQISPGEPIFLDTLAPTPSRTIEEILIGLLLMTIAVWGRIALAKASRRQAESDPQK